MKAETAIKTAPGVLAVKADYATGQATVGTKRGQEVSLEEIYAALDSIGYQGKGVEGLDQRPGHSQPGRTD